MRLRSCYALSLILALAIHELAGGYLLQVPAIDVLVVERQQLHGDYEQDRAQERAGPAGEDDAFQLIYPLQSKCALNRAINKTWVSYLLNTFNMNERSN